MDQEETVGILKARDKDIRARGVKRLAIFGSTVRGDARPASDVDLLVEVDRTRMFSLIDHAGLSLYLTEILGCEADLAMRDNLKPFLKDNILVEAVEVF
jgi:predicted nucleotidyltransferase